MKANSENAPNPKNLQSYSDYLQMDEDGLYAGKHLLIEACQASNLDDSQIIKTMLTDCAKSAGATILHLHTHVFSPNGGISGVAILAESHISIHTWPEISYAGIDVFMCGDTQPELTIEVIKQALKTDAVYVQVHKRGQGFI